jgi:hypothetical protein
MTIWETISEWPLSVWLGESVYGFVTLESIHLVGVVMLLGSIVLLDLRLLGISTSLSFERMSRHVLPVTWIGFGLVLVSGALLFIITPQYYVLETSFIIKLLAIGLGGINMLVFEYIIRRNADVWDQFQQTPVAAKAAAAVSISVWVVALVCGRWMGYEKEAVIRFAEEWEPAASAIAKLAALFSQ